MAAKLTKTIRARQVLRASAIFGMDHPDDEGHT
jgi:hypothetical protein